MTIRASCTACGVKLVAEDRFAGKTLTCPGCQQPVLVPAPTSTEEFIDPFAEEAERVLAPRRPAAATPAQPVEKKRPSKPAAKREATPPQLSTKPAPIAPPPEEDFLPDEPPLAPVERPQVDSSAFPDLSEAELAGEVISPRRKKKPPTSVPANSGGCGARTASGADRGQFVFQLARSSALDSDPDLHTPHSPRTVWPGGTCSGMAPTLHRQPPRGEPRRGPGSCHSP